MYAKNVVDATERRCTALHEEVHATEVHATFTLRYSHATGSQRTAVHVEVHAPRMLIHDNATGTKPTAVHAEAATERSRPGTLACVSSTLPSWSAARA